MFCYVHLTDFPFLSPRHVPINLPNFTAFAMIERHKCAAHDITAVNRDIIEPVAAVLRCARIEMSLEYPRAEFLPKALVASRQGKPKALLRRGCRSPIAQLPPILEYLLTT